MNTFYLKDVKNGCNHLNDVESRHCAQVLRHQVGDEIELLDGKGGAFHARLTRVHKKKCELEVISESISPPKQFFIHLAIAPTKSIDRIEWMVEKLCEIGVDKITFIETEHSERRMLKIDRLEKKAISALKQSKNRFKTQLNELQSFENLISEVKIKNRWIAHVDPAHSYLGELANPKTDTLIIIGPEGDFSKAEVEVAKEKGFIPISLGHSTLRTETAGLLACHLINVVNQY